MGKGKHLMVIGANLWESMLLECSCGWQQNHDSPWDVREIVDICNTHFKETASDRVKGGRRG